MSVDFMGVLRKCAKCKSKDDTVDWSNAFSCYICDECFTDIGDAIEDKNHETQNSSSTSSTR